MGVVQLRDYDPRTIVYGCSSPSSLYVPEMCGKGVDYHSAGLRFSFLGKKCASEKSETRLTAAHFSHAVDLTSQAGGIETLLIGLRLDITAAGGDGDDKASAPNHSAPDVSRVRHSTGVVRTPFTGLTRRIRFARRVIGGNRDVNSSRPAMSVKLGPPTTSFMAPWNTSLLKLVWYRSKVLRISASRPIRLRAFAAL